MTTQDKGRTGPHPVAWVEVVGRDGTLDAAGASGTK